MPKALSREHSVLRTLLKEVLHQTPHDQAIKLIEAYKAGKVLRLAIGGSSRGENCKCAFQWGTATDARLKATAGSA